RVLPAPLRHHARPPTGTGSTSAPRTGQAPDGGASDWIGDLLELPAQPQNSELLTLVRTTAAQILGHLTADPIAPQQTFLQLGFDSLTSVELRNQLKAATG